ncbi:UNVERIFIED_CONTAM: hypothetical protein PYX00_003348 [Menopon gallinae]|uniref:Uncharacterized protein n=1 Tax=Menopon gallinae TaxID=328185 RepID=A0AAW2I050_9NEOP
MMKLVLFFVLAIVALASAGLLVGPSDFEAESTQQVHSPFAYSSSSRVQSFNNYAYLAQVPVAAAYYH